MKFILNPDCFDLNLLDGLVSNINLDTFQYLIDNRDYFCFVYIYHLYKLFSSKRFDIIDHAHDNYDNYEIDFNRFF